MNPAATTDNGKRPTAVIYLRVSTSAQAETSRDEDGLSIKAQREACLAKAQTLGAEVVEQYVDRGESARSAHRPQLQMLLERLRTGRDIDHVICHKLDRMARNRVDDIEIAMAIKRAGATLVSCSEAVDDSPSGKLLHGIIASVAEFYSDNLAHEVRKGMDQKAKTGTWPGRAPLGYRNTRQIINGNELRVITTDPDRADDVAWLFEQYATGDWTLRTLRDEAVRRGVTYPATKKQPERPISLNGLNNVLRNRFYTGRFTYKNVEYDGDHEPLISDALHARVQSVLDANNTAGRNKTWRHSHYLKGILRCARCKSRLAYTVSRGNGGTYEYFYCSGRQQGSGCDLPHIPPWEIEPKIIQLHHQNRLDDERSDELEGLLREQVAALTASAQAEISRQQRRLSRLEKERDKMLQAFYNDAIPVKQLKAEQARLADEELHAEQLLEQAQNAIGDPERIITRALEFARDSATAYEQCSDHDRHELNHAWFDTIYIDDLEPASGELLPAMAALLDPELPQKLKAQNTTYTDDPTGIDWDHVIDQINRSHTAQAHGSKVPLMVGDTGFEPVTSAV